MDVITYLFISPNVGLAYVRKIDHMPLETISIDDSIPCLIKRVFDGFQTVPYLSLDINMYGFFN